MKNHLLTRIMIQDICAKSFTTYLTSMKLKKTVTSGIYQQYIKTTQQQLISILTLILPTILMVLEVLKAKRIFTNTCFVIGIS